MYLFCVFIFSSELRLKLYGVRIYILSTNRHILIELIERETWRQAECLHTPKCCSLIKCASNITDVMNVYILTIEIPVQAMLSRKFSLNLQVFPVFLIKEKNKRYSWLVFICLRMKRKCIQFNLLMLLWFNKRRLYSFKSWQMNIDMWSFKNCRKEGNWLQKIINNPCLSLQGGTAILNLLTCTVP